jgi:hypothetical protein
MPALQRTDEQVQTEETRAHYDVNPATGSRILAPGCNDEVLSSKVDHVCALLEELKNDETRTKKRAARARRQREWRRRRIFDKAAWRIREEERRRIHTERKRMKRKRQRIAAAISVVETPGNGSNQGPEDHLEPSNTKGTLSLTHERVPTDQCRVDTGTQNDSETTEGSLGLRPPAVEEQIQSSDATPVPTKGLWIT